MQTLKVIAIIFLRRIQTWSPRLAKMGSMISQWRSETSTSEDEA